MSAEEIPSLGGTAGHQTARHNCRKTFRSCGVISLGDIIEYNSPLHDSHARHRSFCRRSAEAIGTHHGVLEISAIDASSCQAHAAFSLSQVTEGFTDEQSSAALTEHTPPFPSAHMRNAWLPPLPRLGSIVNHRQERFDPGSLNLIKW